MGYRSDVALAITKEDYELLQEFDKENISLRELLEIAEIKETPYVVVLHWNWIKWYREFPEVQAIDEFMALISERGSSYKFVRIGEDMEDTEVDYVCGDKYNDVVFDAIEVYREINVNI